MRMAKVRKAVFQNGELISVAPKGKGSLFDNREIAIDNTALIESDGILYDTRNPDSIRSFAIPEFKKMNFIAVLDLSYNMKIRCGHTESIDVIPELVPKTLELMSASPIGWRRRDYLQVIRNYYRVGLIGEGSQFEVEFRLNHPAIFSNRIDYCDEGEHLVVKYHFEDQNHKKQEYAALKQMFRSDTPDTLKGYLQIRARRTKRFLMIQNNAQEQGYELDFHDPYHYCQLKNIVVDIKSEYEKEKPSDKEKSSYEYATLKACYCRLAAEGLCNGTDFYGLKCSYYQ